MKPRPFSRLSASDQELRYKSLVAENKKLHTRLVNMEIENLSLSNENKSLKKHIEEKANEKFAEMMGDIFQRAEASTGIPSDKQQSKGTGSES